jgi:hypothetical protein
MELKKDIFILLLLLLLVALTFSIPFPGNVALADSPSFVHQEIPIKSQPNAINTSPFDTRIADGRYVFFDGSTNSSQCNLRDFRLHGLSSVSFISNGEKLNATFWLDSPFKQPPFDEYVGSPFVNDTKIHQQLFWISSFNAEGRNLTQLADDYINSNKKKLFKFHPHYSSRNQLEKYF